MIFSAGQLAALAVVIFFALHQHQGWSALETILLDDPIVVERDQIPPQRERPPLMLAQL